MRVTHACFARFRTSCGGSTVQKQVRSGSVTHRHGRTDGRTDTRTNKHQILGTLYTKGPKGQLIEKNKIQTQIGYFVDFVESVTDTQTDRRTDGQTDGRTNIKFWGPPTQKALKGNDRAVYLRVSPECPRGVPGAGIDRDDPGDVHQLIPLSYALE